MALLPIPVCPSRAAMHSPCVSLSPPAGQQLVLIHLCPGPPGASVNSDHPNWGSWGCGNPYECIECILSRPPVIYSNLKVGIFLPKCHIAKAAQIPELFPQRFDRLDVGIQWPDPPRHHDCCHPESPHCLWCLGFQSTSHQDYWLAQLAAEGISSADGF